jgi:lysyl-tRNA synthetase class 2
MNQTFSGFGTAGSPQSVTGRITGTVRDRAIVDRGPGYESLEVCLGDGTVEPGSWIRASGHLRGSTLFPDAPVEVYKSAESLGDALGGRLPEYRYLLNPATRQFIVDRARAFRVLRQTLDELDYTEVQSPILRRNAEACQVSQVAVKLGSGARAYLRTDPEEYLKRYLTVGLPKVYEISVNIRDDGIDRTHLLEFTSLECYSRFDTFDAALDLTQSLICRVLECVNGSREGYYLGERMDFNQPIPRLNFLDAIADHSPLDPRSLPGFRLAEEVKRLGLWTGTGTPLDQFRRTWLEWLFETFVLPTINAPLAVVQFPVELGLSARQARPGDDVALRGEIYLKGGFELAHVYENLVDPRLLASRYEERLQHRLASGLTRVERDLDLQKSAELGMPPMSGLALGVDRLLMVASGIDEIGLGHLFSTEFCDEPAR